MGFTVLTITVAIAAAVLGGVFYAFSSFIMTALGRIPGPEGMRAMQRINVDVFHISFMGLFLGLPLVTVALAIYGWLYNGSAEIGYLTAAAAAQVFGCFLLTAFGNVPLNEALAKADADSAAGQALWQKYLRVWTRWNHVRTLMCAVSAGLLLAAIL